LPSFLPTRATLTITVGEAGFIPPRFSPDPARLRVTAGSASFVLAASTSSGVTTPKLDRLQRQASYFPADGRPTAQMQVHWQRTMEAIETAFQALTGQVADLSGIVAQIQAANDLASAANATAVSTKATIDIANSFTNPTSVVSASNTGTITIAAHSRVYGDGTTVSVNAGSLSGFTSGQYVTVFYDDAARAGGAVTYEATTNAVAQSGNRHIVGQATIPAVGEAPVTGRSPSAPGYVVEKIGIGYEL